MSKRNRNLLFLGLLSLVYSIVFFLLKYLQYKSFFSFEWDDEASFIQLAYNTFRGSFLHQTIFIAPCCYGRFTPFIIIMAVFYKFFPYVPVWFAVTAISYGISSIVLYLIGVEIMKNNKTVPFIVAIAFLFYAPLHYANLGMIDTKTLSLFPLFLCFYFFLRKRFTLYLIFLILAIMTKQDIALIGIMIGFYCLYKKYPKKWWVITLILSLVYFITSNALMDTIFYTPGVDSHPRQLIFAKYDFATIKSVLAFIIHKPLNFIVFIFSPNHIRALFLILYPLLFMPLLSLEAYISLPIFMELLITKGVQNYNSEYMAAIIPFLFIGLFYFLKKLHVREKDKLVNSLAICILCLCFFSNFVRNIVGDGPFETPIDKNNFVDKRFWNVTNIFDRRLYTMDEEDKTAWTFIKMVPKDASVTASGDLLTPLSTRKILYSFGLNEPEAWENESILIGNHYYPAYDSDYILIHTRNICNGLGGQYAFVGKTLADRIINTKLRSKYIIIKQEGNFILLKRNKLK